MISDRDPGDEHHPRRGSPAVWTHRPLAGALAALGRHLDAMTGLPLSQEVDAWGRSLGLLTAEVDGDWLDTLRGAVRRG